MGKKNFIQQLIPIERITIFEKDDFMKMQLKLQKALWKILGFYQKWSLNFFFYPKLNLFSRHELKYLLGWYVAEHNDPYNRAVRELTLKYQDTQRKTRVELFASLA